MRDGTVLSLHKQLMERDRRIEELTSQLEALKRSARIYQSIFQETDMSKILIACVACLALTLTGAAWVGFQPADSVAGSCCYPGAECCYPGSPCCEDGNCCSPGAECCYPGSPCCGESAPCCAEGSPCCDPPQACCASAKK